MNEELSYKTMWIKSSYCGIVILTILLTLVGVGTIFGYEIDLVMTKTLCFFLPLFGIISFQVGYEYGYKDRKDDEIVTKKGSADE